MKISVIKVGRVKNQAFREMAEEYTRNVKGAWRVSLQYLDERNNLSKTMQWIDQLKPTQYLIVCDERGKALTTQGLLVELQALEGDVFKEILILVGPPDGLSPEIRSRAKRVLSLSALTLTNEMAFLVLCEQLYRCYAIATNHPYHRG